MTDKINDECQCGDCGDDFSETDWRYLHSNCHHGAPAWARVKGNILEVICAICDELITSFIIERKGDNVS